jgi:hypothetical protein
MSDKHNWFQIVQYRSESTTTTPWLYSSWRTLAASTDLNLHIAELSYCGQPGNCIYTDVCLLTVCYLVKLWGKHLYYGKVCYLVKQQRRRKNLSLLDQNSWNVTCYSLMWLNLSNVSIFRSMPPPSSSFIYCKCLNMECCHLHQCPQAKSNSLPLSL